ncbi:iron-containing alcohol dehydrogenase [Sulfitobacter guttiformis]|uniref:Alcohol dehydrogenase class IV n=1 Tax=Sulfitobacter guttiformis TaxID=74349 RepID=A0A420DPG8_9RHOB|nr:iron-containing alcohol dehydrogenase [Sulfitobacter guttiformis]KIN73536.1 Iron-containing alcohol dehydrogenase [Sulfitobacter guttiformis KCTC 32187]RKE96184.1 alcohol dehydrogenase class IV [Sulfitobacter guttiformis]
MFSFFSPQAIHFGRGQSQKTAALAATFGTSVLLVHGASVARAQWLIDACHSAGLTIETISCANEPSLPDIERALRQLNGVSPDIVIGLGGGSVLDFAKALAALICCKGDPMSYLEVVGDGRPLDHPPLPMIALPTTAGTGAEVTKNAVILVPDWGIKVSLRDPRMVPNIAIVDASLMQGAPKQVALAAGLDAVTQVIEPYLSIKANPMTDALCHAAISTGLSALRDVVENDTPEAWDRMAWVSTCGGLALANAGLGAVHGFAGVIGGETNAPHGAICGLLLPAVLESHLRKAEEHTEVAGRLHWVLHQIDAYFAQGEKGEGITALRSWSQKMGLRGLEGLGLSVADYPKVAEAASKTSSMSGNPFVLLQHELLEILHSAK